MKRSRFLAIPALAILILAALEVAVRQLPLRLYAHPIDVLLYYNHDRILSGQNDYDVILFGDSKSMGLRGDVPGMSIYNFSVPALPPAYYRVLFSRYIQENRKPRTLVLAAHSHFLLGSQVRPAPGLTYSPGAGVIDAVVEMAAARSSAPLFQRRVAHGPANTVVGEVDYQARLLRMLDWTDTLSMYEGMDRYRQAYEGLPHLYKTYSLRSELKVFAGTFWLSNPPLPPECNECEGIYTNACNREEWPADRARRILARGASRQGYMNLDDFTSPEGRIALRIVRDRQMAGLRELYDSPAPEIDPHVLDTLVRQVTDQGVRFVYLWLPLPSAFKGARAIPAFQQGIRQILARYPDAQFLTVGPEFFEEDDFIDPLHLSCYGARRLNEHFFRMAPSLLREEGRPR